jgi:N-terminal acetyltransferase B complex catalytic subunit
MTSIRPMGFQDLFRFNNVNFDHLTETYGTGFYGEYFTHWPAYQQVAVHGPTGVVMGYMLGKAEGKGEDWHGHVSAVTVAPEFRRAGLAQRLMDRLEDVTASLENAYFVDLFVRKCNTVAQGMYLARGYVVYRTVLGYYAEAKGPGEDALDLRKAMPRNAERSKSSVVPLKKPIRPDQLEWA